jgi:YjbE family integral membrane protein
VEFLQSLDFAAIFTAGGLAMLAQIILADLTMAGDNVLIMGTIASGLPVQERQKVILLGVGIALVFLIGFALVATWLLSITGLLFAGGCLLLWVAYNMYRELRPAIAPVLDDPDTQAVEGPARSKTFLQAAIQITLADLSMSLDNVLVVAGIARENPAVLFVGLTITVAIMGIASTFVARLIQRWPWIAWIGLALILFVAVRMIHEGWVDPQLGLGRLFA